MIRFEHPHMVWLLLLIPAFIIVQIMNRRWRRKAREKYAGAELLKQIMPRISSRKPGFKFVLYCISFALLVVAIANPQMGTKIEEVKRKGVDLVIALDVSNSMKAEDFSPNRLELAKRSIEKLVEHLHGDRLGLVVFAGDAFIQLPITSDYSAAKLYTSTIGTNVVPIQGTAIGKAIEKSISSLSHDDGKNRAIIVISDGENHEDDAVKAAAEAFENGIFVHCIGMGSPQGAPVPIYNAGKRVGFKSDKNGNTVVSKLDEGKLQEIASAGHGIYVRATNSSTGLKAILDEINQMEKKEYEARQYTDFEDRFQPFILAALALLIIEFIISEKKSKWVENFNLFNT